MVRDFILTVGEILGWNKSIVNVRTELKQYLEIGKLQHEFTYQSFVDITFRVHK